MVIRLLQHFAWPKIRLHLTITADDLKTVEAAVKKAERGHSAQIRVCIEGSMPITTIVHRHTPRERAQEIFAQRRIWDTEHNNGVLVYLMMAERAIEVVCDRGAIIDAIELQSLIYAFSITANESIAQALSELVIALGDKLRVIYAFDGEGMADELPDAPELI